MQTNRLLKTFSLLALLGLVACDQNKGRYQAVTVHKEHYITSVTDTHTGTTYVVKYVNEAKTFVLFTTTIDGKISMIPVEVKANK